MIKATEIKNKYLALGVSFVLCFLPSLAYSGDSIEADIIVPAFEDALVIDSQDEALLEEKLLQDVQNLLEVAESDDMSEDIKEMFKKADEQSIADEYAYQDDWENGIIEDYNNEVFEVSYFKSITEFDDIEDFGDIAPASGGDAEDEPLPDAIAPPSEEIVALADLENIAEAVIDDAPEVAEFDNTQSFDVASVGDKAIDFLNKIPANGMARENDIFIVKENISIDRATVSNVFKVDEDKPEYSNLREDVKLEISVKESGGDTFGYLSLAYNALIVGKFETAIENYNLVLKKEKSNLDAMFGLASALHGSGKFDEAKDWYVKILDIDNKHIPALNNLLVLISEVSPEDGIEQLKKLQKTNPEHEVIPAQIGFIYMQQGEYQQAAINLKRALMLNPENLDYRYNFALLIEYMGADDKASEIYRSIINEGMRGKKMPVARSSLLNRIEQIARKKLTSK